MQTAVKISAIIILGLALLGIGFFVGHNPPLSPSTILTVSKPPAEANLTGTWEVHLGKAVDTLALTDDKGVLTGEVTKDPQWGGATCPVHGIRVGSNVQWIYEWQQSGPVNYTMNGTLDGDSIGGTFTILSAASALASPHADEKNLWTARRK